MLSLDFLGRVSLPGSLLLSLSWLPTDAIEAGLPPRFLIDPGKKKDLDEVEIVSSAEGSSSDSSTVVRAGSERMGEVGFSVLLVWVLATGVVGRSI